MRETQTRRKWFKKLIEEDDALRMAHLLEVCFDLTLPELNACVELAAKWRRGCVQVVLLNELNRRFPTQNGAAPWPVWDLDADATENVSLEMDSDLYIPDTDEEEEEGIYFV